MPWAHTSLPGQCETRMRSGGSSHTRARTGAGGSPSPSMTATHAGATTSERAAHLLRPQSKQRASDLTPDDHVVTLRSADPEVRVAEDTRARLQAAAAEVRGHAVVAVDPRDRGCEFLDRARAGIVARGSGVEPEDDRQVAVGELARGVRWRPPDHELVEPAVQASRYVDLQGPGQLRAVHPLQECLEPVRAAAVQHARTGQAEEIGLRQPAPRTQVDRDRLHVQRFELV